MPQVQLKSLITFLYLSSSALGIPVLEEKGTSCTAPEGTGTCQSTSTCTTTASTSPATVPGPSPRNAPFTGAGGLCLNTSDGCTGGSFIAGFCPGNSGVQCCVKKSDTSDKEDAEKGSASGKDVVQAAVAKEGVTYVFGGGGCKGEPNGGFDCSARTAQLQYHSSLGKRIPRAQAKAGDFIFWGTNGDCVNKVHHVGIFMRSNWMVNAPHTGSVVRESTFEGSSELCDYAVRFWKD
ncbi:hypothetical protein BCON_0188g00100 [Botryotinia convoluta]|uniref:NlpC/P60 domain-containing protein n=1 Tax=Botryotinia convoluta TaxID=54673 RepID=A0A4Z1HMD2_9HELO|nr:hypothetical protein BCON_0188g00100 [Botryotinia convoluta]